MKTVRDIGEFGLIARLQRQLRSRHIGDDCAVLPGGDPKKLLLFTCDPVVEGVHFLPGTPARQVGWKAMARNLSDIAAMGGLPRWAVISIGLCSNTPLHYVDQLYAGMRAVAGQFDCEIVGGDTTHVRREPFIAIALLGEVERDRVALRSGARPGDVVFVTGTLGGSLAGKHLRFIPRIKEARWLVEHFRIHAMMDISDGLASDLCRLIESSHVGFRIQSAEIPGRLPGALTDGEDFELVFTVSPRDAVKLKAKWRFRLPLTEIGQVIHRPVLLMDGQGTRVSGYDHFATHDSSGSKQGVSRGKHLRKK